MERNDRDCENDVVEDIKEMSLEQKHGSNLTRIIHIQVRMFEALRIEHIYREANRRANSWPNKETWS